MTKELKYVTELELSNRMRLLDVDHRIDKEALKKAFKEKIRLHHTDKGGDEEVAKEVTLAYRLLNACLETGRRLPRRHTSADLLHHNMSRSMHSNLNNNPAHHADDMSRSATQPTSSGASSSSSSANTSPTAGAEPAAPRRRYRRAYPYYTVEDHVSNTFSFFFDGMNDNLFSSQYYDVDLSRFFEGVKEDVLPRFRQPPAGQGQNFRGFF